MSIQAVSPLDGRYQEYMEGISSHFSEWALLKYRVHVELEWLIHMSLSDAIKGVRSFSENEVLMLRSISDQFDEAESLQIKEIEKTTKHDVKAVEYYIKQKLTGTSLEDIKEFVHFTCTSEDINNLSHALMLKNGIGQVWLPLAEQLIAQVAALAHQNADVSILSRTHGQTASPSTLGKELAVFVYRWERQASQIRKLEFLGKFNGATGNFNAHTAAYPDADWESLAQSFVEHLGLTYNPLTTQIESHDYMAECFHALIRFNNILMDFDRDMWSYISLAYFKQQIKPGEVGSSTMPHKVNPINFENSEANLGLSLAVLDHLANKLPISRLQRDLTDSSALRNMGVGIAHSYLALQSALKGLSSLSVNKEAIQADLDATWEVLGEAIQTVMRREGMENPYERLKELTRGAKISQESIQSFVKTLGLPSEDEARMLELTPSSYIGIAPSLLKHIQKSE